MNKGKDAYETGVWAANCRLALETLRDTARFLSVMHEGELRDKVRKVGRALIAKACTELPEDLYKQIMNRERKREEETREGKGE